MVVSNPHHVPSDKVFCGFAFREIMCGIFIYSIFWENVSPASETDETVTLCIFLVYICRFV